MLLIMLFEYHKHMKQFRQKHLDELKLSPLLCSLESIYFFFTYADSVWKSHVVIFVLRSYSSFVQNNYTIYLCSPKSIYTFTYVDSVSRGHVVVFVQNSYMILSYPNFKYNLSIVFHRVILYYYVIIWVPNNYVIALVKNSI